MQSIDPQEIRFAVMRKLQENPQLSQRQLADDLGVSLGKTNYVLKALIEKGFVKAGNFMRNPHKAVYSYLLTPAGLEEKAKLTVRFLKRKRTEYEQLKAEIDQLSQEVKTETLSSSH